MNGSGLQRLIGRIKNVRISTTAVNVFITQSDRAYLKATAGATALAGSAGLGIGLLALDADTSTEADLMEFDLEQADGTVRKIEACVWLSPFEEGDEVEVVAERLGDVWKGVAVARPSDRLVAVYPLCTHGRSAHWKKVAKWWWWITVIVLIVSFVIFVSMNYLSDDAMPFSEVAYYFALIAIFGGALFGIVAWSIGRKVGKLVPLSEAIFQAFGWKNPRSFDLYATTRAKRRVDDPEALGLSYFRY